MSNTRKQARRQKEAKRAEAELRKERGAHRRASEKAAAEGRRRALSFLDPDTPPERAARVVIEDPVRADELLGSAALVIQRSHPGLRAGLADCYRVAGRPADAADLLWPLAVANPADQEAVFNLAAAVQDAFQRTSGEGPDGRCPCGADLDWSECCRPREEDLLVRFADRQSLDRLGEAVNDWLERTGVMAQVEDTASEWIGQARLSVGDPLLDQLIPMSVLWGWRINAADESQDAPIVAFASDPATPPDLAAAARVWADHVTCGLWLVADPRPSPGLLLRDVVTGVTRYAAVPAGQVEHLPRWSVLAGSLVPVDGVWRPPVPLIRLSPDEGDFLTGYVRASAEAVASEMSGKGPRASTDPAERVPYGVLIAEQGAPSEVAGFVSVVANSLLPQLISDVDEQRHEPITLTNTDGHPMVQITARIGLTDPDRLLDRLANHPDFSRTDDGDINWWGRAMTGAEVETTLAELESQTGQLPRLDQPLRWLRGKVIPEAGGVRVEVNSEERYGQFLAVLHRLGEPKPQVTEMTSFDYAQDTVLPTGAPLPAAK